MEAPSEEKPGGIPEAAKPEERDKTEGEAPVPEEEKDEGDARQMTLQEYMA